MTFQEFQGFYNERRQFYQEYPFKNLLQKAYIKLRKGSEIRFQDVDRARGSGDKSGILSEILVELPQIKLVKDRIQQSLQSVKLSHESDVCIVYGDYGHGKSQTAHMIIEDLLSNREENVFAHLENISTFRNFFNKFSKNISSKLSDNTILDKNDVEPYLNTLSRSIDASQVSVSDLIQTFVDYIKFTSDEEIIHIVILDELDKIVQDEIERKNWIDLLVTLNDESDLALLIICLIPQRMAEVLINTDRRLERWNHFFNINSTILDGKYSSEVVSAISTVLALHDFHHDQISTEKALNYVYDVVQHKLAYLESTSIRNVNTWVLILGELIKSFEEHNIWQIQDNFKSKPRVERFELIKKKFQLLLHSDNLPQFDIKRDDSDEIERYRLEFSREPLIINNFETDGQFKLHMSFLNTEKITQEVCVLIELSEDDEVLKIDKIGQLAEKYPVLIFDIGPDNESNNELNQMLRKEFGSSVQKYPIQVVNIPGKLVAPLLLFPDDVQDPDYSRMLQLCVNWSNVITGHRDDAYFFLKELPLEITRKQILMRSYELAKMTPEELAVEAPTSQVGTVQSDMDKGIIFLAANIVSTVEEIQTFKYINTIEKNVTETLMVQFPADALVILQEIPNMIKLLSDNELVITGGNKRPTIKKSDKWDQITAINLLKSNYST